jgi:prepilin-type N-terminal cleavage/methylation domain-containing protein
MIKFTSPIAKGENQGDSHVLGRSQGYVSHASENRSRGNTLIEIMVTIAVLGVLASFGIPRFTRALEQSRVDMAAANLRAIWTAQRLYWLKHQIYADSLTSLVSDPADSENFLDPSLVSSSNTTYLCQVTAASATDFTATATRAGSGSSSWTGSLAIASDGTVMGSVRSPGGISYQPSPSFQ